MTRLEALHRSQPRFIPTELTIPNLYSSCRRLPLHHIPVRSPEDHTMVDSLDLYAEQKLPVAALDEVAKQNGKFEIHGVYPSHFDSVFRSIESDHGWEEVPFYHKPTTRKYNTVRPRFFVNQRKSRFVICLAPGSDYIQHYGSIVRHFSFRRGYNITPELYYYPVAFESLHLWTQLGRSFVRPGDRVLIGYVEEMHASIVEALKLRPLTTAASPYYESRRYALPAGGSLAFLGVNFSFWGNLAQALVQSICMNSPAEVIYVGKLGSLTHAESLYKDLFIPSSYFTLSHTRIMDHVEGLRNGLLEFRPSLDTGAHVSVPTVMEEDFQQRAVAAKLGANSIDNEISQMARAVQDANIITGRSTMFSSFHFATDLVRSIDQRFIKTSHDLSNNRDHLALSKKEFILRRQSEHLIDYFGAT